MLNNKAAWRIVYLVMAVGVGLHIWRSYQSGEVRLFCFELGLFTGILMSIASSWVSKIIVRHIERKVDEEIRDEHEASRNPKQ